MKYIISWFERPQGSPMEYENAQKRILEVFGQWKAPGNFKIDFFVIRVGEWGGHMLMECDDPVNIHKSFKLREQGNLRNMVSRRQLQGFSVAPSN